MIESQAFNGVSDRPIDKACAYVLGEFKTEGAAARLF